MMQNIIDNDYLDKLGVINNPGYREFISEQVVQLLNMRVANRVAEILSDEQLREMTATLDGRKMIWLENNVPNFEDIVGEELKGIVTDIQAVMPS